MFQPILSLQWKSTRWGVILLTPLCFGLPILFLQIAYKAAGGPFSEPAMDMLRFLQVLSPVFALLALLTGATFALGVWTWDHRTNHVYALSLPLERWRYALLKMSTGALLLAVPVFAAFAGALIASMITPLPTGLHPYPFAFGLRFLLGALIVYAVMFAFAAGTIRTTVRILIAVVLIFVFGTILTNWIGNAFHTEIPSPIGMLIDALTTWPGPFHVFGGNWMLVDV
jgi:hypothetical protein